jgi:uncharacterized SAM-binding protein YcdF (DUF218 family)
LDLPRKSTKAGKRVMVSILLALLAAYLAGFLAYVSEIPVRTPPVARADGIVALTGGMDRLSVAAALLEKGAGKRLLITGVHMGTTKDALRRFNYLYAGRKFDCCVDLGFQAANTHGNAKETAAWAREHDYKSLILVTASYHMPRSLTEFGAEMPSVKFVPYPVAPEHFNLRGWWHDPLTFSILQWEYIKFVGTLARQSLFSPKLTADPPPASESSRRAV